MDAWIQIKVNCRTEDLETVSAIMSMYDNALMIEDPTDVDGIETIYGELIDEALENADREKGSVSIFVTEEKASEEYLQMIRAHLCAAELSFTLEPIGRREEDWKDIWKQFYKPLAIGEHLTVVPLWEKETYPRAENEHVVLMDPGVAFGSGTHETTRLCAALLEKYMKPGERVLDVGTGSGILAIAAAVMGAGEVFAYDLDPVAVRIARENTEVNGVADKIVCGVSDLMKDVDLSGGQFEVITANIVADILLRMAPDVCRCLKPGGILLVSGIIDRQADQVREALEAQGLRLLEASVLNDWNALAMVR